ncbi:primosomal protein DnaI [Bacillus solimangrovi]|uniref:Primosomal protein DnaI n=1 Tax=Bacillus solimangrovi TaxID=1305675 RepID=A0A1E5LCS4_9BACI|nr:primosomal protein DnaI [Bacillus solimangrovi]OEH91873.1 primosomal protein DnaI [Bacillus solimangrovi]
MEPIQRSLRGLRQRPGFKERYETLKREVMEDRDVQSFITEHEQQLNRDMIERSLGKLYEFTEQKKNCNDCPNASECVNMLKGHWPKLFLNGALIDIRYETCEKQRNEEQQRRHKNLLKSMYMSKEVLQSSIAEFNIDEDDNRAEALTAADRFVQTYQKGHFQKGLYLYGKFGVGKTYLLGAIANELADRGVGTLIVYTPEFLRELKSSLQDGSLNEKIETVKTAEILMLDDIGAEAVSSWVRDEILGTILQYRMMEGLPTFFTSNYNYDDLEHHLSYTQRGEEEKLKAARIMERIQYLTRPIAITGKNYRKM